MKKIRITVSSVCLVLLAFLLVSFSTNAFYVWGASSESPTYDQFLAEQYLHGGFPYNYYINEFELPYRSCVEEKRQSKFYQGNLAAWEIATFDLSNIIDLSTKRYKFNETMLFDVLYSDSDELKVMSNLDKVVKSTQASTIKKILKQSNKDEIELMKKQISSLTGDERARVQDMIKQCETKVDNIAKFDKYFDYLDYAVTLEDFFNKCVKINVVRSQTSESMQTVLENIKNTTSDKNLSAAITEMNILCSSELDNVLADSIFVSKETAIKASKKALSGLWSGLLTEMSGMGYVAVSTSQTLGKTASKMIFTTEKDFELFYQMSTLYDFEDSLRKSVKQYASKYLSSGSTQDAANFNASIKLLMNTYILGMKYAEDYLDMLYKDGALNELFLFGVRAENYSKYKTSLENIKNYLINNFTFFGADMNNLYLEEVEGQYQNELNDSVDNHVALENFSTNLTSEQVTNELALTKHEVFETTNVTINKNMKLTEDMHTYGSLILKGTLDLNGHTLTVDCDVRLIDGTLTINGGTLNVGRNLIVANYDADNDEYTWTESSLVMNKAGSIINVHGDFIANTNPKDISFQSGVLNLYGNLISCNSIDFGGDARINMLGSIDQKITGSICNYSSNLSKKTIISVENSSSRRIIIEGTLSTNQITGDSNIVIEAINIPFLWFAKMEKNISIIGDVKLSTTVYKTGGMLTVNGTLYSDNITINAQQVICEKLVVIDQSILEVSGGKLETKKDLIFAHYDADNDKYTWIESNLEMLNAESVITVQGDFIANTNPKDISFQSGVLNLYGNLISCNSIDFGGDARINLLGSSDQKISGSICNYGSDQSKNTVINLQNSSSRKVVVEGFLSTGQITGDDDIVIETVKTPSLQVSKFEKNISIIGDVKLSTKLYKTGGMIRVNGTVYSNNIVINGQGLTCENLVVLDQTTLEINGGMLETQKDLVAAHYDADNDEYTWIESSMKMQKAESVITVLGNMITNAENISLSEGVLNLYGNVYDYSGIYLVNTARVNLLGNSDQYLKGKIGIGSVSESKNTILSVGNTLSRKITIEGNLKIGTLEKGYITIYAVNNPTLNINKVMGKLTVIGNATVNIGQEIEFTALKIKNLPNKTTYYVGDLLDTSGLALTAEYSDGSQEEISEGFTVDITNLTTVGKQIITVTYQGKTTTFDVQVNKDIEAIAVANLPQKTVYKLGEILVTDGLTLAVKCKDGSIDEVTEGFICTPAQLNVVGKQTVTVTYQDKTTTFESNSSFENSKVVLWILCLTRPFTMWVTRSIPQD